MAHQSGLPRFEVASSPDEGFERFADILVQISGDAIANEWEKALDRVGRRKLREHAANRQYMAVHGIGRIKWRSADDRQRCMADQASRKRWQTVEQYAEWFRHGVEPPVGPVYVHPDLTGSTKLIAIDGARRVMAALEAGRREIDVVVVTLRLNPAQS